MMQGPPKKRGRSVITTSHILVAIGYICVQITAVFQSAAALRHQLVRGVTIHQHEIIAMQCLTTLSEGKSMKVIIV